MSVGEGGCVTVSGVYIDGGHSLSVNSKPTYHQKVLTPARVATPDCLISWQDFS